MVSLQPNGKPKTSTFLPVGSNVLIIDEENGDRLLQKRLFQLGATTDLPIYFRRKGMADFGLNDERVTNTISHCKNYDVKLIIFDSLIRIHDSDENSARDMSKVFKHLKRFADQGISVLVTQHNRKQDTFNSGAANEMRGSSDILAAVDAHIGVTRKDKWYLVFSQTKQRYDVELDPFQVKVTLSDHSFSFEYLGTVKPHADKSEILRTAVTELLQEHGQLMQKDLLDKLTELDIRTNEHALRELLSRWVSEGLLLPPLSGIGNTKLYRLNTGGDNA